jgi:hypothetical protein
VKLQFRAVFFFCFFFFFFFFFFNGFCVLLFSLISFPHVHLLFPRAREEKKGIMDSSGRWYARRCQFDDLHAQDLANAFLKDKVRLRNLRALDVYGNEVSGVGAAALAQIMGGVGTLTSLNLGWNVISDEGAKWLAEALKNNNLTDLQFFSLFLISLPSDRRYR